VSLLSSIDQNAHWRYFITAGCGGLTQPFKQLFIFSHDGAGSSVYVRVCVCVYACEYRTAHRLKGKLFPRELSEGIMSAVRLAGNGC